MNAYFENNILYKLFYPFVKMFSPFYQWSFLHRIFAAWAAWYAQSTTYACIQRYTGRNSTAKNSLTYRFISGIARTFDKGVGKLHHCFFKQTTSSLLFQTVTAVHSESKTNLKSVAFAVILPLLLGFSLVTTLKGSWGNANLLFVLFFIVLLLASMISLTQWKGYFKNSKVIQICSALWE